MRILVHDYGGYPFPVQLSRALAARGHDVRHVYCASLPETPSGDLARRPDDPPTLTMKPLRLRRPLAKYNFVQRRRQEVEYGRLAAAAVRNAQPDIVLSANTPLGAQRAIQKAAHTTGARFVFWVQDLIGVAAGLILRRKLPIVGVAVGYYYRQTERSILRRSDAAVVLTEDFRPLLTAWGVPTSRVHVIENWAPLDALPVRSKQNAWAEAQGLAETRNLVYTGTLAMKHDPSLLLEAARRLRHRPDVRVVVVSQGRGADWLRAEAAAQGLGNLIVRGYEPFERVPDVMGAADVLTAVLEPEAGTFSVPSKVLAYLCAGRPILLSMPADNLSARIVRREEAGLVVLPKDADAFTEAAERLLGNDDLRTRLGRNGRAYAEAAFAIDRIADRFETVLTATADT